MASKLMEFFNKQPRIGVLATASRDGKVNAAHFGSPFMSDEKTVVMGFMENRTLKNLQENPNAVYIIVEPGESMPKWKGLRVYLRMERCERQGQLLEDIRSRIAKMAGEAAAKGLVAAVSFQVTEIRPLVDFGQGWEKAV